MAKKRVVTVKDRRSEGYDYHNVDHRNEKLFTVLGLKNSTRFRVGEMISDDTISRLNIENDWEVIIK